MGTNKIVYNVMKLEDNIQVKRRIVCFLVLSMLKALWPFAFN